MENNIVQNNVEQANPVAPNNEKMRWERPEITLISFDKTQVDCGAGVDASALGTEVCS